MNNEEEKISSYEKGVKKLLENRDIFEWIISNYIVDIYTKFNSSIFPTTQIAKVLLNKLNRKKTQFGIIHKLVREIFKMYEEEEILEEIKEGRYNPRKTKIVYRVNEEGIKILKSKIMGFNIKSIEGKISEEIEYPTKTREQYLLDYIANIFDTIERESDSNKEFDELEEIENNKII